MTRSASILSVAILIALLAPAVEADIDTKFKKAVPKGHDIPQALPGRAKVVKGMSIEVELKSASALVGRKVEFLLREHPQFGKLSKPRREPGVLNRIFVTYTAHEGTDAIQDTFKFAVRVENPDRRKRSTLDVLMFRKKDPIEATDPVSVSATVTIKLIEPMPVLEVDQHYVIGDVLLGEQRRGGVAITNIGTAPFVGKIEVEAPFSIENDGIVYLDEEESVFFPLAFAPTEAKTYRYTIKWGPDVSATTTIHGNGVVPFTLVESKVELKWDGAEGARKGLIQMRNPSTKPIELSLSGDERLRLEKAKVVVPALSSATVVARLPGDDVALYSGSVLIKAPNFSTSAFVKAPGIPGKVERIDSLPANLSFDRVNRYETSEPQRLKFRNSGGEVQYVKVEVDRPFEVLGPDSAKLPPRGEFDVLVALKGENLGQQRGVLRVRAGDHLTQIPLLGIVVPPGTVEPKEAPVQTAKTQPGKASRKQGGTTDNPNPAPKNKYFAKRDLSPQEVAALKKILHRGIPHPLRKMQREVPMPTNLYVKDEGRDFVVLAWKPVGLGNYNYDVLLRDVVRHPHPEVHYGILWISQTDAVWEETPQEISVRLNGLTEGNEYVFRAMAKSSTGAWSGMSAPVAYRTPDPRHWSFYLIFPAAILGIVGFWMKYRPSVPMPRIPVRDWIQRFVPSKRDSKGSQPLVPVTPGQPLVMPDADSGAKPQIGSVQTKTTKISVE